MSRRSVSVFVFLCLLLCLPGRGLIGPAQVPDLKPKLDVNPSGLHLDFGSLPLYFVANRGQVDGRALFYAMAARYTLWLTEEGLVFDSFKSESPEAPAAGKEPSLQPKKREARGYKRDVSRLVFLNAAQHPEIVPVAETGLRVNYFIGNDPAKWHAAVPTSEAVLYRNVYDRIDLKVYGIESRIEYDWIVRPGGDPGDIRFEYRNVKGTRVDEAGNLLIETGFGELVHKKPAAYQEGGSKLPAEGGSGNGTRAAVEAAFKKIGENAYGFEVKTYEAGLELVIDPVVLAYSTYLGGSNADRGYGIAVDGSGNAYVTGETSSANFPTLNQYQTDQTGLDAFVTKIDTTKSGAASLVYSTYLGGSNADRGYGIAVDGSGNAYVTGETSSANFPIRNQYQTDQTGLDAFVTKIDTTKSGAASLVYSTYLGGNDSDYGNGIAVDGSGNAYVTGETYSANFSIRNQYQADQPGLDAFVTKIDTTKSGAASLVYSTYLGGSNADRGYGIAVDGSGNAYVTGETYSANFPTLNQYQTDQTDLDAFVTKIDTTKSGAASLVYSTYLGGSNVDRGRGIAADGSGNAYVTGETSSANFPIRNQYQADQGNWDGFVVKINTNMIGDASLVYSTYLGGNGGDSGRGIAVDGSGNAYVTGYTGSANFPTLNQYQTDQTDLDAFVTKIDTTKSGAASLVYSTYLGGNYVDCGYGIAVDGSGNAYVTGETYSANFPTLNQYQTDQTDLDAFITKISEGPEISVTKTSDNLTPKVGETFNFTVTVTNNGLLGASGLKVTDSLPAGLSYVSSVASKGTFTSATGIWDIGALSNAETETLTIGVKGTSSGAVTNTASVSALNESDPDSSNDSASATVTVKNTFALTIAAGAGGTTSPVPGTYTYDEGTLVSIQATASAGYRFGSWSGDASGSTNPVNVTMNSDKTVTANFIRQFTLTIAAGAGGTTNPAPGTYTYDEGTLVSIQATASAGYRFGSWTGDASGSTNPVDVTMTSDKRATANFIRQYTLTIAAGTGGTTSPVPGTYTYDEGSVVSITATASAGYRFGSWTGDASGSTNPVDVTMTSDKTVTANFIRQYTLTIAAGAGGTTSPVPGTYTYDEGTSVSIQATASAGYRFGSWTGDASGSTNPVDVTMTSDKRVTANFIRQYTLTIAAGAGGTTSPVPGTYTYDEGTAVSIQATASAGYRFGSWSGDASGSTNPVSVTMNSDKTVTANFIRQYTLTIIAGVGGTTSPVPGTYIYDEGTSVSIQATASAGYRFGSWSGDASGSTNPISITMNANKTVTANFIRQFTLTVAAGAGGTTNPAPGTYTYDEGSVVSITATASAGYRFGSWSGDASGSTNPVSVTMNSDKTVTANFIRQYTLTIAAGAGGTTSPVPGTYTYDEGTAVSIQATASAGYRFGSWSGDASGSTNPVSVTMNSDKTVTANFIRQYMLTIIAGVGGTTNPVLGTYTYDEGTSVSIQATASAGYRFGSWTGDASGSVNPVSVTMNSDKTVTANFIRQYTLTIAAGAGGTTNPAPGTYTYDEGTAVSVQAVPAEAYQLDIWTGDASGSANPVTIVMNGNKAIQANFIRVVKSPLGLTGERLTNRNVSMVEYVIRLRWQPNTANTGTISYRIYQIENGQAAAIADVGAGTYEYIVRRLLATRAYRFGVTAVNSQGWESDMVEIAVQ